MSKYFDFHGPLERRYIFNSFLVVVALVEALILVFTLIWQVDEGIFSDQVKVVPFPWKEYLLASFTAPIALLFLFGLIVRGFEFISREAPAAANPPSGAWLKRRGFPLGVLALLAALISLFWGGQLLVLVTAGVKALGLGGAYLIIALLALAMLYLPLRLVLRYRLQKKAMEYQYLQSLAERHGLVLLDPQNPAGLKPEGDAVQEIPSDSQKSG
jgi:hypothetical protein